MGLSPVVGLGEEEMQVAAVQSSNARTELTVTELMDADPKEN